MVQHYNLALKGSQSPPFPNRVFASHEIMIYYRYLSSQRFVFSRCKTSASNYFNNGVMQSPPSSSSKFSSNSYLSQDIPPETPKRACGVAETTGEAGPKYVSGILGPLSWYGFFQQYSGCSILANLYFSIGSFLVALS